VDTVNNTPFHPYCLSEKLNLYKTEQTVTGICIKTHIKINYKIVRKNIRQPWAFESNFLIPEEIASSYYLTPYLMVICWLSGRWGGGEEFDFF